MTCDAGHKTVSADAGVPTCIVVGHSGMSPLSPGGEHLPIQLTNGLSVAVGELLYLLRRHICPTVNNFDSALLVCDGRLAAVERISARGREGPLLHLKVSRSEAKIGANIEVSVDVTNTGLAPDMG
jgi:hypothetical protein